MWVIYLILALLVVSKNAMGYRERKLPNVETWTGRYLPERVTPATIETISSNRIPMGAVNAECDDANTKLEVDWLDDIAYHTCFERRDLYKPNFDTRPLVEQENIPHMYQAAHACMNESITYSSPIPTFGTHRPLWPKWGEYTFVPVQRWIHNLEHGGIVMLYHPCANHREVNLLRKIVKRCLYRYIITPYTGLSPARPLVLVAWGARVQMSAVSTAVVNDFIKNFALKGPEQMSKDGQYSHMLVTHSEIVSDIDDNNLCPNLLN